MPVTLAASTIVIFRLLYDVTKPIRKWAEETNCAYPEFPRTLDVFEPTVDIAFADEQSAILFKLRFL